MSKPSVKEKRSKRNTLGDSKGLSHMTRDGIEVAELQSEDHAASETRQRRSVGFEFPFDLVADALYRNRGDIEAVSREAGVSIWSLLSLIDRYGLPVIGANLAAEKYDIHAIIARVFHLNAGNASRTARELGLSRSSVYAGLKNLRWRTSDFKDGPLRMRPCAIADREVENVDSRRLAKFGSVVLFPEIVRAGLSDNESMILNKVGKQSTKTLEEEAKKGAEVSFIAGLVLLERNKIDRDFERSEFWLSKAAEAQHVSSIHVLGLLHAYGFVGDEYYENAQKFWKLAVSLGDAESQYFLGLAHFVGIGCNRDTGLTESYWEKSAQSGYWIAIERLSHFRQQRDLDLGLFGGDYLRDHVIDSIGDRMVQATERPEPINKEEDTKGANLKHIFDRADEIEA